MDGKKIILGAILILALVPNLEAGRSECWLDGHSCRTLYPPAEDIFYGCCPGLICIPTGGPDFEGECSPAWPLGYKATGFNRTLGIVDTNTRPMKYTMLLRFHEVIEISRYVPTLISPFPIEEPSEG
ncbi:uncharacterized protein LOC141609388 [Silene latifolia]|uniref:uncharacterized protein LOC141609388 n=1 Tax=Silene latifolia TaxID=37657 RepID=UPI003D7791FD